MIVIDKNNANVYILRFVPYYYPNEDEQVRVVISNTFGDEIIYNDIMDSEILGNGYLAIKFDLILDFENDLKYKLTIKLDNEKEEVIYTDEIIFTMKNKYDFKYNKSDDNFLKL